jgi:hypothetical protein
MFPSEILERWKDVAPAAIEQQHAADGATRRR